MINYRGNELGYVLKPHIPHTQIFSGLYFPIFGARSKSNTLNPLEFQKFGNSLAYVYNQIMWFVYLLLCKDGSIYTGITNDLVKRFGAHKNGRGGHYTRSHKAVKIVYSEKLKTKRQALRRELQVKKLSHDEKFNMRAKF